MRLCVKNSASKNICKSIERLQVAWNQKLIPIPFFPCCFVCGRFLVSQVVCSPLVGQSSRNKCIIVEIGFSTASAPSHKPAAPITLSFLIPMQMSPHTNWEVERDKQHGTRLCVYVSAHPGTIYLNQLGKYGLVVIANCCYGKISTDVMKHHGIS